MEDEKQVVKTDAVQYTLLPGETVLLELKVKEFGDNGEKEIVVSEKSTNPIKALLALPGKLIGAILKPIKKLFGCCTPAEIAVVESGSFVVTNMRCFIAKAIIEEAKTQKKPLLSPRVWIIIGIVLCAIGCIFLPLLPVGLILIIIGFASRKKAAGFTREDHAFTAFPRSILTEYNSFTCNKELITSMSKGGCCSSMIQAISYKTVLTIGMNTKGEKSAIEPNQHLELTLDPTQVANHEQALAVISKLSELAQKAN